MSRSKRKGREPVAAGPSRIHGTGLFAVEAFARGATIGVYEGPRTKRDGEHVLWLHADDGGHGIDGKNALRWVNHSRRPNAVFEGEELVALKRILPGEEITHDYGDDWSDV